MEERYYRRKACELLQAAESVGNAGLRKAFRQSADLYFDRCRVISSDAECRDCDCDECKRMPDMAEPQDL